LAVSSSLALCLLFAAYVLPARAQLYSGSIAGTVTDSSGAVVVSAQVTATDTDKGFKFSGKTDNAGRYLLRNIPPGSYAVSVEASGFESQRQTGIVIAVTQNASVRTSSITPGSVAWCHVSTSLPISGTRSRPFQSNCRC
jgi:hypothetical protein